MKVTLRAPLRVLCGFGVWGMRHVYVGPTFILFGYMDLESLRFRVYRAGRFYKLCLGLVGLLQLIRCIGLLRHIRCTGFKGRRFFRRGMVQRYANRRSDPRNSKECTQCNSFERGHFRFGTTRSGIPSVVLKCYNVKEFSKVKPKGSMYLYSRYLSLKGVPI